MFEIWTWKWSERPVWDFHPIPSSISSLGCISCLTHLDMRRTVAVAVLLLLIIFLWSKISLIRLIQLHQAANLRGAILVMICHSTKLDCSCYKSCGGQSPSVAKELHIKVENRWSANSTLELQFATATELNWPNISYPIFQNIQGAEFKGSREYLPKTNKKSLGRFLL